MQRDPACVVCTVRRLATATNRLFPEPSLETGLGSGAEGYCALQELRRDGSIVLERQRPNTPDLDALDSNFLERD